jgi:hypothetical protein
MNNIVLEQLLYCSPGAGSAKNNSKNKKRILYGEKENFEEYSLNLESAELSFPTLINYSAGKCRTYPQTMVVFGLGCNT